MVDSPNYINVKDPAFGAVGDGLTDDAPAINAAIAAVAPGGTVRLDAGGVYRVKSTIHNYVNGRKSVNIDATGATVLIDHSVGGDSPFKFHAGYKDTRAVTAYSDTNEIAVPDPGSKIWRGMTLTLDSAAPTTWKRGDILRISGDDVIPGTINEGGSDTRQARVGQFVTVISNSGTTVVVAGELQDPWTKNRRVAKLDDSIEVSYRGGKIKYTDEAFAYSVDSSAKYVFNLEELAKVVVEDVHIERCNRGGFYIRDSHGWRVSRVKIGWGPNSLKSSGDGGAGVAFGYGILNQGSAYGTSEENQFGQLRHGYTNGHGFIEAGGTGVGNHGRPYSNTVINCKAYDASSTAYDSHSSGLNETFDNCQASNCAGGFGLRGEEHNIYNAVINDVDVALFLFDDGVGGRSWGHQIDGVRVNRANNLVRYELGESTTATNYKKRETRPSFIRNVHATGVTEYGFRVTYGTLELSDWYVKFTSSGKGNYLRGSAVRGRGITLDFAGNTATNGAAFEMANGLDAENLSSLEIDGARLLANDGLDYFVKGEDDGHAVRLLNVIADSNPSINDKQVGYVGYVRWAFASKAGLQTLIFGRCNTDLNIAAGGSPVVIPGLSGSMAGELGQLYKVTLFVDYYRVSGSTDDVRSSIFIDGTEYQGSKGRANLNVGDVAGAVRVDSTLIDTFKLGAGNHTVDARVFSNGAGWRVNAARLVVERA